MQISSFVRKYFSHEPRDCLYQRFGENSGYQTFCVIVCVCVFCCCFHEQFPTRVLSVRGFVLLYHVRGRNRLLFMSNANISLFLQQQCTCAILPVNRMQQIHTQGEIANDDKLLKCSNSTHLLNDLTQSNNHTHGIWYMYEITKQIPWQVHIQVGESFFSLRNNVHLFEFWLILGAIIVIHCKIDPIQLFHESFFLWRFLKMRYIN